MAKYNEYREKAVRLDLLTEILTSAHIKVRMIHLGGTMTEPTPSNL